jgi:hypothetical protein
MRIIAPTCMMIPLSITAIKRRWGESMLIEL